MCMAYLSNCRNFVGCTSSVGKDINWRQYLKYQVLQESKTRPESRGRDFQVLHTFFDNIRFRCVRWYVLTCFSFFSSFHCYISVVVFSKKLKGLNPDEEEVKVEDE